ncbi:MAG: cation:proton antiporter [Lentimicrobiaceae bacterium]|nr:cation:proton antiporter [Lentimicrobiaceae bacterium]MCB9023261.1 cation:proton antiporter [Lentimicrobiaceae bacterium]MCO5266928.1 cation:proton antiporter [Lentimicrobium sp.]
MTTTIIITFCLLLLIAYLFDLSASKTRIPSVILLLILGWVLRQMSVFFEIKIPDLTTILPVFGTIGLILIVLEASLELELDKSKVLLIKQSLLGALLPMFALTLILTYLFYHIGNYSFRNSLINAIPFSVISSAVAIPSVRNLAKSLKEFIIYESSFSDIAGVIFFNFIALNVSFGLASFVNFGLQLLVIILISFVATIALAILLHRIEHHIKFVPIILLVILIYAISEIYHLPALVFIMSFGLFIGNLNKLKRFKLIARIQPEELEIEGRKFKEITTEAAFLVRALFFLLFGFILETSEILNTETLLWSSGISLIVFILRAIHLEILKQPLIPLLFVAPRGLITILLFLSIEPVNRIIIVNKSLVIQVIVICALIMMFGLMLIDHEKPVRKRLSSFRNKQLDA